MDITVQINIKGQAGELSIPEMGWQLRFADQYAGFIAVYRLCETDLLDMEAGGVCESDRKVRVAEGGDGWDCNLQKQPAQNVYQLLAEVGRDSVG